VTYELVPGHGPIIPAIDRSRHALVPRTAATALAVRTTSDQPTFELRALYQLARAGSVAEGFRATADITDGSQSWMMIDRAGHIGWTTNAQIPVRPAAAYAWNPDTHQDSLAPFFVLPGDGTAEWAEPPLSTRYIPHAVDPPSGMLVAANADPVGATADGLPLNQATADGQPLYAGVSYAAGLRDQRIAALIRARSAAGAGFTADDAAAIQLDTRSLAGEALTPAIVAALDRLDRVELGPSDVNPYLDTLSPDDTARLATARRLLASWTFATPAATAAPDDDSAATAVFHAWIHAFIERAFQDELDVLGFDVWRLDDDRLVRIVYAMLTDPRSFVTSPSTQQPILCDNYAAAGPDDSCTKVILQAMVDAMTHLESPQAYGTADPGAWRWGSHHQLVIAPLVGSAPAAGVARDGDNFSVSRSDPRWSDLDFAERTGGTALRMVAGSPTGGPMSVKWSLPGGTIDDPRSPHDHDLRASYLTDTLRGAAFSIDEIVAAGEARWVFH
jgi:penicillin amidase